MSQSSQLVEKNEETAPSLMDRVAQRLGMDSAGFKASLIATILPSKTKVSQGQVDAFLAVSEAHGLNPFTKEIFAFPSNGGIVPVVSVDGWVKLIQGHPKMDGATFQDHFDEAGKVESITCRIHRKDRGHPTEITEYMAECWRPAGPWKSHPRRMLRHKALIQCARVAFGFSGIYDEDEAARIVDAQVVDSKPMPSGPEPSTLGELTQQIQRVDDGPVVVDVPYEGDEVPEIPMDDPEPSGESMRDWDGHSSEDPA